MISDFCAGGVLFIGSQREPYTLYSAGGAAEGQGVLQARSLCGVFDWAGCVLLTLHSEQRHQKGMVSAVMEEVIQAHNLWGASDWQR